MGRGLRLKNLWVWRREIMMIQRTAYWRGLIATFFTRGMLSIALFTSIKLITSTKGMLIITSSSREAYSLYKHYAYYLSAYEGYVYHQFLFTRGMVIITLFTSTRLIAAPLQGHLLWSACCLWWHASEERFTCLNRSYVLESASRVGGL